jgi:hypothetical protein
VNIEDIKEKVLGTLDRPMRNVDIYAKLKKSIPKNDIGKAIRDLRAEGKIVSIGDTAARKHMLLSTAIEALFIEVRRLKKSKLDI